MKFLYVNMIYMTKSILPRFFFFNILIYLWSLKNVDVEKWFFKFIKKRRIENDMYINKVTEKLLKYKQK